MSLAQSPSTLTKTLTIVCPVYNEAKGLEYFFEALSTALSSLGASYAWKVLFVADRCTDATFSVLRALAGRDQRVQALLLSNRFGHQVALVAGMDHCDSDAVVMMDSDLQHPPELIPKLLEKFEE